MFWLEHDDPELGRAVARFGLMSGGARWLPLILKAAPNEAARGHISTLRESGAHHLGREDRNGIFELHSIGVEGPCANPANRDDGV